MEQVINIHDDGHEIDLEIGKYKIDVLGGWGIKMGQFSISLKHTGSEQITVCERSFWPVQTLVMGKRARRIFAINVDEAGTYKIKFGQPETLEIKESNLFFTRFFQESFPNDKISICIHR